MIPMITPERQARGSAMNSSLYENQYSNVASSRPLRSRTRARLGSNVA
jgi:hypothetical protein